MSSSTSRQPTSNNERQQQQHHHRDHNDDENATAEMAFQLIERGNAFEKTGNCWAAAENYGRSVHILDRLSKASLEEATTSSPLSTTTTSRTTISNTDSLAKRVAANKKIQEQINKKIQEQIKISKLYSMKSNEYLIEGRKCFFKAITFENELDEMRIGLEDSTTVIKTTTDNDQEGQEQVSVSNMISEDEAQRRLRIFSCLYAHNVVGEEKEEEKEKKQSNKEQTATTTEEKAVEISQTTSKDDTTDNNNAKDRNNNKKEEKGTSKEEENKNNNKDNNYDDDNVDTKQINNIEERLQELNDTLPSGFKTSKERMNDIDRGLRRLGLSLYSHQDEKNKRDTINSITPQISDEEQIEQIMAQAKDEAMYERQKKQSRQQQEQNQEKNNSSTNNEGIYYNDYELDSDSDDDDNDDDYDNDEESDLDLYTTKIQNRKFVRKMIQKAQIKLAKLAALIDDKKSIEENDNNNNNVILDDDDDDDDSNNNENSELGRKTLLQTRYCLDKALKEW